MLDTSLFKSCLATQYFNQSMPNLKTAKIQNHQETRNLIQSRPDENNTYEPHTLWSYINYLEQELQNLQQEYITLKLQHESQVQFLASGINSRLQPSNLQSLLQTKKKEECNLMSETIVNPIKPAES